ncbi:VCBS domain-containing protein [Pseudoduganella sp. OTU4001]|uniref:VCBS domain-containing protein n=1 Tax=Pseudoduganella sp. OTU4001 TaxID=3043854 RepID=UPI00313DDD98
MPGNNTNNNVADQTGAAKDDSFTSAASGLTEDHLQGSLDVLPNDPGSAALYSMWQAVAGADPHGLFPVASSGLSALGATVSIGGGMVLYDAAAIAALLQSMHAGETMSDSFLYTVRMANGALSTANVTLELAGANDLATITGDMAAQVQEDGVLAGSGTLLVSDVDHDEAHFAAVDAAALHGVYGEFTFVQASGAWTYTLRNGDANVQALNTGDTRTDSLVVKSLDGTATATINVTILGVDEPAVPPNEVPVAEAPAAAVSTTFMVNHGLSTINGRNKFTGFDSDDMVKFAKNLVYKGFALADADGNGSKESTVLQFVYKNHPGESVDVTLVGYTGWTDAQLFHG